MSIPKVTFTIVALLALASRLEAQQDSTRQLVTEGRTVFEGKSGGALCFSCHGSNAKGIPGVGPDLTDGKWLNGDGTLQFIEQIVAAGVPKPKQAIAPMPPMGGAKLSDRQRRAVAAYVHSLNQKS